MPNKDPIFIHAGFRTGGTALAFAFRKLPEVTMFYDPLSPALELRKINFNPSHWASNHPPTGDYFEEYREILDGYLQIVPSIYKVRFDYEGQKSRSTFLNMIDYLVSAAEENCSRAVFKLETSEGRILDLQKKYPNSLHIGLVRDITLQEQSWSRMAESGEYGFYHAAWKLIALNPKMFNISAKAKTFLSFEKAQTLFSHYEACRRRLLLSCDLIVDITKERDIVNLLNLLKIEGLSGLDTSIFSNFFGKSQEVNNTIGNSQIATKKPLKKPQLFISLTTTLLKRSYLINQTRRTLTNLFNTINQKAED